MPVIKKVLVIPSYKEYVALPVFIEEIFKLIDDSTQVLIADDSPIENWEDIVKTCEFAAGVQKNRLTFSFSETKSGRGGAVRRGFQMALTEFSSAIQFLECDADGSHRAEDVMNVMRCQQNANVVIGSRYIRDSKIIGWPVSRRIFSRILNFLIPRMWDFEISDVTNGLRSYDLLSVQTILSREQKNKGFVYLTEQMIYLKKAGLTTCEIPICFVNRTFGKSTVGAREIAGSLTGLVKLFLLEARKK